MEPDSLWAGTQLPGAVGSSIVAEEEPEIQSEAVAMQVDSLCTAVRVAGLHTRVEQVVHIEAVAVVAGCFQRPSKNLAPNTLSREYGRARAGRGSMGQ